MAKIIQLIVASDLLAELSQLSTFESVKCFGISRG